MIQPVCFLAVCSPGLQQKELHISSNSFPHHTDKNLQACITKRHITSLYKRPFHPRLRYQATDHNLSRHCGLHTGICSRQDSGWSIQEAQSLLSCIFPYLQKAHSHKPQATSRYLIYQALHNQSSAGHQHSDIPGQNLWHREHKCPHKVALHELQAKMHTTLSRADHSPAILQLCYCRFQNANGDSSPDWS